MLFAKRQALVHGILVVVLATALVIAPSGLAGFSRLIACIAGFSSGCLVAMFVTAVQERRIVLHGAVGLVPILALAVFVSGELRGSGVDLLATFLLSGLLIITLVCGADGLLKRILRSRPLAILGEHSYSLYMSHWAVIYMADVILKRTAMVSQAGTEGVAQGLEPAAFCIVFLTICAVIALLSWASFRFVEQPFRLMSRSYAFRKLV